MFYPLYRAPCKGGRTLHTCEYRFSLFESVVGWWCGPQEPGGGRCGQSVEHPTRWSARLAGIGHSGSSDHHPSCNEKLAM